MRVDWKRNWEGAGLNTKIYGDNFPEYPKPQELIFQKQDK